MRKYKIANAEQFIIGINDEIFASNFEEAKKKAIEKNPNKKNIWITYSYSGLQTKELEIN